MGLLKRLRYLVEAGFVWLVFAVMRIIPLDIASAVGGFLGRNIAILHKSSKTAKLNLRKSFPELSDKEINKIVVDMWDNIGRTAAEYPHLPTKKMQSRIEMDFQALSDKVAAQDKGVIFIAAHIGNWELAPIVGYIAKIPLEMIYRPANNPYVDKIIADIRRSYAGELHPKGRRGAMKLMRALKDKRSIAMLVDQKMNDGISVPFFGREAMTAPAAAQMALKYDSPIYMLRVVRKKGVNFFATVEELDYKINEDEKNETLTVMKSINKHYEQWIREYPAQWFWMHNRWPKDISSSENIKN